MLITYKKATAVRIEALQLLLVGRVRFNYKQEALGALIPAVLDVKRAPLHRSQLLP